MIRDVIVVEIIQKKKKTSSKKNEEIILTFTRYHLQHGPICCYVYSSFFFCSIRESKYKNLLVTVFATWGEMLPHKLVYMNFSVCACFDGRRKNLIFNTFYKIIKEFNKMNWVTIF